MKCDEYISQGYPIGSGVVESACGHLVKNRMEIAGARWGIRGAESILKLRSVVKSDDWDEYWKFVTTNARLRTEDLLSEEFNSAKPQYKLVA